MLVLDASAAAELLLGSDLGLRVAEAVAADGNLHAPHLLDAEVLSTVRSLVARAEMAPARAVAVLDDLADLPITRHAAPPFLAGAWELRSNVTGHDALYVALAEALDAPLVTCDGRLARASGPRCPTVLV